MPPPRRPLIDLEHAKTEEMPIYSHRCFILTPQLAKEKPGPGLTLVMRFLHEGMNFALCYPGSPTASRSLRCEQDLSLRQPPHRVTAALARAPVSQGISPLLPSFLLRHGKYLPRSRERHRPPGCHLSPWDADRTCSVGLIRRHRNRL